MSTNARPVAVPEWWDVFTFTGDNQIECPDCEQVSDPLASIWQAVCWVDRHYQEECNGGRPDGDLPASG